MLITNVEIDGALSRLRIAKSTIKSIACDLEAHEGEVVVDGHGGALVPGLHDHHIHLNASAAALNSVKCGPPSVRGAEQLIDVLHANAGSEWIRGIGYHPSVAGEIDRDWLDQNGPNVPIRLQHRGGRMWIFNSRAMDQLKIEIPADGRLVDGDKILRGSSGTQRPDLGALIKKLHSFGITGVTEVTPENDLADFDHYREFAQPLNLTIMGGDGLNGVKDSECARVGPLKIHNHDHNLPPLAELTSTIARAHDADRAVAIHCVTRAEMMLSLAAIEDAGVHSGDRIEHAAIADENMIELIAKLGLTIVTQPHFITERQVAYLNDVEEYERPHLWRLKSFIDAGIGVAGGSDAPFGGIDPWKAMASAVQRPALLSPAEAINAQSAFDLYTKPAGDAGAAPRKVAVGEPADLCLLDKKWKDAARNFADLNVMATWVKGELVYDNISSTRPHSAAV